MLMLAQTQSSKLRSYDLTELYKSVYYHHHHHYYYYYKPGTHRCRHKSTVFTSPYSVH